MTGQVSSWLLQCYLLLLLVHPLDPSSHPGQGPGISGLHAKELELWDMDPEPTPWVNMNVALLSKTCLLVELLITGIVLGRYLRRRLRRGRREEKHQSPSAPAGQGCCPEHGCPTKLMQLLKRNRTMLQLCLQHCSQQKKKAKRGAQGGFWKRRRFRASPKH
ncbi:hypothetical protein TURU_021941 [Turdus rufiventris]|nr:hypothetical protein TURU_021941 [Turdus rufiventris]